MNEATRLEIKSDSIRWWPSALFVVCVLASNVSLLILGSRIGLLPCQVVMFGLMLGQGIFASVVAGLAGRIWLQGLLIATGFVGVVLGLVFFVQRMMVLFQFKLNIMFFEDSSSTSEVAWGLFFLPLVCLAAAMSGLIMRFVFGWCLTCSQLDFLPRKPIRLIDFFLVMTTFACLLGVFRIPLIVWNGVQNNFVGGLAYVALAFGLCNLVIGIPCTYFVFRTKRPLNGFLRSFGYSIIPPGVIGLAIGLSEGSINAYLSVSLATGAVMGFIVSLGLLSLRCGGVRLLHYPPTQAPGTVLETESNEVGPRSDSHLVWTAWVTVFAILCSLSITYLASWRASTENKTSQLQQELSAVDSSMSMRDWRVVGLTLGPNASEKTLDTFPYSTQIETLSIARSNLSNAVVDSIERFRSLKSLDLSYSDLDEGGLRRLTKSRQWRKLQFLSIAGTKITPQVFSMLPRTSAALRSVDLSDLGVTDDDLSLSAFRYESIRLAKNQITDKGIPLLFSGANTYYRRLLDLSNNPIDGSGFAIPCTFSRLVLDGTPLTDDAFGPQLKNLTVHDCLVLRNSQLTDSFLSILAATTSISGVEFGDGNFTEKGFQNLTPTSMRKLSLTGKQFTGECFKNWSPFVNELSMRGSSLSDETLGYVATLTTVYNLDLSNTAITDAGLGSFPARSVLSFLNLSNTRVTAKGLMASPIPPFCEIRVAPGQFTSDDLRLLRTKWKVVVADPLHGPDE